MKRNCLSQVSLNADIGSCHYTNKPGTEEDKKKNTSEEDAEFLGKQTHNHLPDTNKLPAGLYICTVHRPVDYGAAIDDDYAIYSFMGRS
jgi:hypothetical protein